MDGWVRRATRAAGSALGALTGVVAVQYLRLRRMTFLPPDPGFRINHLVHPRFGGRRDGMLRLAVLGDSTTAGVGVERPEEALPFQVAQRIADREGLDVRVVSYGWAGARAADVAQSQLPAALTDGFMAEADIVAVVIGANDATHRTPPGRFRAALRDTFAAIAAAVPNARVVHAGVPAFRGALRTLEPLILITDSYARLLRPVSRSEAERAGVAYADLAREVPPRIRGRTDILSSDRFHPSAAGYGVWADVIVDALARDAAPRTRL